MSKKIYDILPPKMAKKVEDAIVAIDDSKKSTKKPPQKRGVKNSKNYVLKNTGKRVPFKEVFIGGLVIFLLFAFYVYAKLPKAEILLWPKIETASFEEEFTIDTAAATVNDVKKIISAQYLFEEKEGFEEFSATGVFFDEGRATGTIVIYNKAVPLAPVTLVRGTHFLSDSGKYFVTLEKATIPPASYQKGKLVAGSINVKMQAKEVGEEYNIKASKFSIPKLSGTAYYYTLSGESKVAMSGGYSGTAKKVTEDDINRATDSVAKKLLVESEDLLRNNLSDDDIVLDGAIFNNIISVNSSVKQDAQADSFTITAKVKVSLLSFRKSDIDGLIKNILSSKLPGHRDYLENSLAAEYNVESIDIKKGTALVNVKFSIQTYQKVDTQDLADLFRAKKAQEISKIINSRHSESVEKSDISFWPFWVKKAPDNIGRIEVKLTF